MRKHYDFSNAVKNHHADKLTNGYTIIINHRDYDEVITVTKSMKQKKENDEKSAESSVAHAT